MVKVKEIKECLKTIPFPKLMKSDNGRIVLFSSPKVGTLVSSSHYETVGYYSNNWDEECFKDYGGTIELTNEKE